MKRPMFLLLFTLCFIFGILAIQVKSKINQLEEDFKTNTFEEVECAVVEVLDSEAKRYVIEYVYNGEKHRFEYTSEDESYRMGSVFGGYIENGDGRTVLYELPTASIQISQGIMYVYIALSSVCLFFGLWSLIIHIGHKKSSKIAIYIQN